MKILAAVLFFCGIWVLWSAVKIDFSAQQSHRGSVLHLMARDEVLIENSDKKITSREFETALHEGMHGYELFDRAETDLALSGICFLAVSGFALFLARKPK
jgi:hypothetical protein